MVLHFVDAFGFMSSGICQFDSKYKWNKLQKEMNYKISKLPKPEISRSRNATIFWVILRDRFRQDLYTIAYLKSTHLPHSKWYILQECFHYFDIGRAGRKVCNAWVWNSGKSSYAELQMTQPYRGSCLDEFINDVFSFFWRCLKNLFQFIRFRN